MSPLSAISASPREARPGKRRSHAEAAEGRQTRRAVFHGAVLRDSVFRVANLEDSDLDWTDFRFADFRGANMDDVDSVFCDFTGALFWGDP